MSDTTETVCDDSAHCRCPGCLADDVVLAEMAAEASARCDRCEQSHGTCQHTAAPIAVGDVIDVRRMSTGRWSRVSEMRPRSVAVDQDGDRWTRTRSPHGWWQSDKGMRMDIADIAYAWGPLTVVHVAGGRAAR